MGQLLLFIVVALVVAAIVFGVTVMVSGGDPGLTPVEPDGKAVPLPIDRPLGEEDVVRAKFDTAFRGYRMSQVDQALQRAAYDIGYKGELISVLEAEVTALREGRTADADVLRRAREAAIAPPVVDEGPVAIDLTPEAAAAPEPGERGIPDQTAPAPTAPSAQATAPSTQATAPSAQAAQLSEPAEKPAVPEKDSEPAERR